MDRKMTQRVHRPAIESVQASEFPPMSVKPPKLKNKGLHYPSGNPTGTESFAPFEAKLREVLMAPKSPPKK
jgi:hypothetical protein